MAALTVVNRACKLSTHINKILSSTCGTYGCIYGSRGLRTSRYLRPYLHEMFKRRERAGPDPIVHPSAYGCWNYDAEIYAFGKRLGENFDEEKLKSAFVLRSYLEKEIQKREEMDVDLETVPLTMSNNEELATRGEEIASRYIKQSLRCSYPSMFEEGISAVHDHLMSTEVLAAVGSNIGVIDLAMSSEYPCSEEETATLFKAVIGALFESQNEETAEKFVKDLVLPQLIGKDINELWNVTNPMGVLASLLKAQGRGEPEPRLLWKSGAKTVMSLYHVGIYSDQKLIGKSPGESASIAEEMAARDALKNLMGTHNARTPVQFQQRQVGKSNSSQENPRLEQNSS